MVAVLIVQEVALIPDAVIIEIDERLAFETINDAVIVETEIGKRHFTGLRVDLRDHLAKSVVGAGEVGTIDR